MNETRDASCPEPETPKNESKLDDSIQKFDEVVRDLPPIYVNRSNTAKGLLHAMFRPDILKRRFKNSGIRMLRGSLLMPNTAKYVYAAEKLVSIVVPNTPVATFMKGVRNAVFLDQFVGDIVPKIEFAGGMNVRDKLHKVFGSTASAPISLSDYPRMDGNIHDVWLAYMFIVRMCQLELGERIEVTTAHQLRMDEEYSYTNQKKIHFVLKYKNGVPEWDGREYKVSKVPGGYIYVIVDVPELQHTLVVFAQLASRDILASEKAICFGGGGAAVLYWNEEAFQQTTSNYVPDISFGIIDPQAHGLTLHETWMSAMRRTYDDPQGEIFDANTRGIIDRMRTSMQRGFSRAYALVGVPGTGKTYIMEKFVRESPDAFVICLDSMDSLGLVVDIVSSIQQRNVIIMMDDVDKLLTPPPARRTVETTEGNTPSEEPVQETKTGKLIRMFADLRRVAPGGVDPKTGAVLKNYTVVATMNNPKLFNNAVIKRSGRFDEVIEIGLPHPSIYMKRLMGIQVKDDRTNYAAWRFRPLYRYMRLKRITLADVSNLYDIMRIHRTENRSRYGVKDMFYAIRCLSKNRSNADKEYAL